MIVMGIDASTTSSGWSVFNNGELMAYGVIKPQGSDWRDRLVQQGEKFAEIIRKYNPEKIYMEDVPLKQGNAKALVVLGAVQGFIYGITSSFSVPVNFIQPSEWRSPLGLYDGTRDGTKRHELKRKSVEKANELFGLKLNYKSPSSKFNDDDISDAILVAYSQVKSRKIVFKKH